MFLPKLSNLRGIVRRQADKYRPWDVTEDNKPGPFKNVNGIKEKVKADRLF